MPYLKWEGSLALFATYADWYELPRLLKILQEIKRRHLFDFQSTNVEKLSDAFALLNAAVIRAPYSQHTRFPQNILYVCESIGVWAKFWQQRALLYSSLIKNDNYVLSCYELLTEMLHDALCKKDVFDRNNFEEWSDVVWSSDTDESTFSIDTLKISHR